MTEEILVPFRLPRAQMPMGTEFKSTWLTASLDLLRERDLFVRYLANLPLEHHEAIVNSIAGVWLPAEVCIAHYRAADALGLSPSEHVALGKEVTRKLQRTIFSIGFRAAREVGVTPWTMLKLMPTNWNREWRGGGVAISKLGPKEARVEVVGFAGSGIPYCRNGMRGVITGLCELVCTKAYVQDIPRLCTEMTMGFRVSWA